MNMSDLPRITGNSFVQQIMIEDVDQIWRKGWASGKLQITFFPKQLTVGVLNATLDLAALVLVGVVGFLGSEVVLSPVVSHCLRLSPFM